MIYFDCSMGAAGDMLSAALYEVLSDAQKNAFTSAFASLGIPHVTLKIEKESRCGIAGTRFCVLVNGEAETSCHDEGGAQELCHTHGHSHHHTAMQDIEAIVSGLNASGKVKSAVMDVYRLIAAAESEAHGEDVSLVHFHEVGAMDAVADVASFALLLETLGWPLVKASSVNVGSGVVHCAHGTLPVPAPATAILLQGIPFHTSSIAHELCTPTGAALLRRFVLSFDTHEAMTSSKIGYGIGSLQLSGEVCNCVRAFLCTDAGEGRDEVAVFECEIDDMTGEEIGFACERLLEEGALDVHTAPVYMKKGRPGITLTVLCAPKERERIARLVFSLTSTLGVRESIAGRRILSREVNETPLGVRIKTASGYGVLRTKCEADDAARIARERGTSLRDAAKQSL